MNSPTIEMERNVALAKLQQYETAAKANPRRTTDQDRQIMAGYRTLAKGGRLVDVNEAIKHGGLNRAGQPKLAIARASAGMSVWRPGKSGNWRYSPERPSGFYNEAPNGGGKFHYGDRRSRITDDRCIWRLVDGTFPGDATCGKDVQALAPLIPLPHRPKRSLENYFLLWEANWHPAPPIDPYLLRPLYGSLMEIIAEWDVSPVELAAVRSAMTTR